MKKKYFYGIKIQILVFLFLGYVTMYFISAWNEPPPTGVRLWISPPIAIAITVLCYLNFLSIRYFTNEEGIGGWSFVMIFMKNETIKWSQITHVEKLPLNKSSWLFRCTAISKIWHILFGHIVSVRAVGFKSKEIWVMSGMHNWKELLRTVVENSKDNPGIVIDPKVLEIINR